MKEKKGRYVKSVTKCDFWNPEMALFCLNPLIKERLRKKKKLRLKMMKGVVQGNTANWEQEQLGLAGRAVWFWAKLFSVLSHCLPQ